MLSCLSGLLRKQVLSSSKFLLYVGDARKQVDAKFCANFMYILGLLPVEVELLMITSTWLAGHENIYLLTPHFTT